MTNRLSNLRPRDIGFLLVGGIVAAALSGTAIAITDTKFTYTTEKTGHLSIHPMDLSPMWNFDYSIDFTGAFGIFAGGCASTGINLPQGAKVVSLVIYYTADDDTADNPRVFIIRNNLATDQTVRLVDIEVADTSDTRKSTTRSIPSNLSTILNGSFSYSLGVCLGTDDWFEGARITYRYKTAGD